MSFFGLTYMGPKKVFNNVTQTKTINDFSDRTLTEAYRKTEKLHGKGTISIDEIRILLSYVYGSLPPEKEVGLFTRWCDLESRGPQLPGEGAEQGILLRVTLELFLKVADKVRNEQKEAAVFKEIAGVKQVASEFNSFEHADDHRHKHLRSHYNPQDKYVKPVTTSMEIGWYVPAQVERVDRKPNISCEETRFAAKYHLLH
jgi:hypothetical protein